MNEPTPSQPPDDQVTVGELEDRSNRNSWRIMYVFITLVVLVFVVMGVIAFTSGQGG